MGDGVNSMKMDRVSWPNAGEFKCQKKELAIVSGKIDALTRILICGYAVFYWGTQPRKLGIKVFSVRF